MLQNENFRATELALCQIGHYKNILMAYLKKMLEQKPSAACHLLGVCFKNCEWS